MADRKGTTGLRHVVVFRFAWGVALASPVTGWLVIPPVANAGVVKKTAAVVEIRSTMLFGKILVTTKGYTLYTRARDTKNHSSCTGQCILNWPALTVAAGVTPVGNGLAGLGFFVRPGGEHQVTYQGKPLYRFSDDTVAGASNGEDIADFSVVEFSAVTSTTSTTTTTTTTITTTTTTSTSSATTTTGGYN